jgi:GNAT superfamily N-acetyltransferase
MDGPVIELPDGLTSRPATVTDVVAITELIAACEDHDDGAVEIDPEDVVMAFGRVGWDPATDSSLVFERDALVGWGDVYRGRAEGDVRPSHRGRGIGAAILAWTEARARALGLADVGQTKTAANVGATELFLSRGYRPTWESWILRIELDEPPPPPVVPDGIAIRPYDPARDEPAVHRLMDDAFTEWPGREPEPPDVWASQTIAHAAFAPSLSPLAFDGDQLVGVVLSYDFPDADEGWVGQLATTASHRRRGIAGALLRAAFTMYRERGRRRGGVSTDTRTGARGLYERQGMRVVRTYTRYTKDLGPPS